MIVANTELKEGEIKKAKVALEQIVGHNLKMCSGKTATYFIE